MNHHKFNIQIIKFLPFQVINNLTNLISLEPQEEPSLEPLSVVSLDK